jgi:hypothetical protein
MQDGKISCFGGWRTKTKLHSIVFFEVDLHSIVCCVKRKGTYFFHAAIFGHSQLTAACCVAHGGCNPVDHFNDFQIMAKIYYNNIIKTDRLYIWHKRSHWSDPALAQVVILPVPLLQRAGDAWIPISSGEVRTNASRHAHAFLVASSFAWFVWSLVLGCDGLSLIRCNRVTSRSGGDGKRLGKWSVFCSNRTIS